MTQAGAAGPGSLTRGSLLSRNVTLNLLGSVLPGLAFLIAVPILVRALGEARFGLLGLAWTTIGYFSFLDLGIGRAVTHAIADRLGSARGDDAGAVIWTSLWTTLPIGILAGTLLFVAAPALVGALTVPSILEAEATTAFRALALAVPFATTGGVLRGALEANQFFGLVNAVRIPLGLITFLGPLATLPFSRSLVPCILVLSVGRAVVTIINFVLVVRTIPSVRTSKVLPRRELTRSLLAFGGWYQVSTIVSPLMVTLDRFIVGVVLGVGMVTYYMAPQELVTKLWLFNIATLPVFFSAAAATGMRNPARTVVLFDKLLRATLALLFLPALALVYLAPEVLSVWLGSTFAIQSTLAMQLIAVALLLNCLGQVAMTLIQALGRPDVTGKFHLVQLPIYALILWLLLGKLGIVGAALAWSLRTIADTIMLMLACPVLLPETRATVTRVARWMLATAVVLMAGMFVRDPVIRAALVALAVPAWIYVCWKQLITPEERGLPLRSLIAVLRPERA